MKMGEILQIHFTDGTAKAKVLEKQKEERLGPERSEE